MTSQAEIIQTFLPDAEVDDVLNVAGHDGHLREGAHAQDQDGGPALLWSGAGHSSEILEQNLTE